MAFIPIPECIQVEIVYHWDGQKVQNVLHYDTGGTITPAQAEIVGAYIKGWWDGNMQPLVASNVYLLEIFIRDMSAEFAPVYVYSDGLPMSGAGSSPSLPNNVSLALTKRTILRGRSYRGRLYHIGLCEGQVTGNTVDPNVVTNLISLYGPLLEIPVGEESYPLVVASRYQDKAPRSQGVMTRVISWSSDGMVDSQRRRLPGRGQ